MYSYHNASQHFYDRIDRVCHLQFACGSPRCVVSDPFWNQSIIRISFWNQTESVIWLEIHSDVDRVLKAYKTHTSLQGLRAWRATGAYARYAQSFQYLGKCYDNCGWWPRSALVDRIQRRKSLPRLLPPILTPRSDISPSELRPGARRVTVADDQ